jgi:hypothetical protein
MNRRLTYARLAIAAAVIVTRSPSAWALTPGEGTVRRQLIHDAQKAHDTGDHGKALSLAQKALALESSASLLFLIAQEEEETGDLGDSYATAQQCRIEAERDLRLRSRHAIIDSCQEIEGRLKNQIGHVVVDLKDRPPGLRLAISGQELNEAALGVPYPITPGTVVVDATAPDRIPFRAEVQVGKGETKDVSLTLAPKLVEAVPVEPERPAAPTPPATATPASNAAPIASVSPTTAVPPSQLTPKPDTSPVVVTGGSSGGRHSDIYALVTGSVGVAALAAGGIVWLVSNNRFNQTKDQCNSPNGCAPDFRSSGINEVSTLDKWAAGLTIAGGVAVVVAGALHFGATHRDEEHLTGFAVDPVDHTLLLQGRF